MMPANALVLKKPNASRAQCNVCGSIVRVRGLAYIQGKYHCFKCKQKRKTTRAQQSIATLGKGYITLEQAMNKTYTPRTYFKSGRSIHTVVSLPNCLAGKKFKIILIEGGNPSL